MGFVETLILLFAFGSVGLSGFLISERENKRLRGKIDPLGKELRSGTAGNLIDLLGVIASIVSALSALAFGVGVWSILFGLFNWDFETSLLGLGVIVLSYFAQTISCRVVAKTKCLLLESK